MSWKDYDRRICLEHHVHLEGYHPAPEMKDPSDLGSGQLRKVYDNIIAGRCKFVKMTEVEVAMVQEKVDAAMDGRVQETVDDAGDGQGVEVDDEDNDDEGDDAHDNDNGGLTPSVGSKRKRGVVAEGGVAKKRKTNAGKHAESVSSVLLHLVTLPILIHSHRPLLPLPL
jgi:hypothetical protein